MLQIAHICSVYYIVCFYKDNYVTNATHQCIYSLKYCAMSVPRASCVLSTLRKTFTLWTCCALQWSL